MSAKNPEILRWARETSGLSLQEATSALRISRPEKLQSMEAGVEQPSRSVLLRMSKLYRRSLLTFYLAIPPKRGDRGQDFRNLPPDRSIENDAVLDTLIRDLKARQGLVRSIVEEDEDIAPLKFIGSRTMESGVTSVVRAIESALHIDLQKYRSQKSYDEAFSYLRERAESAGIFVLLAGNLGTHHTAIPVEMFRGFAIADHIAPFVVINDQDARPAWSFTLIHETAHLFLGATGVSGGGAEKSIERFCNDIAGELLLPQEELSGLDVTNHTRVDDAVDRIARFARPRYVSRMMVAYKLFRTKRIRAC